MTTPLLTLHEFVLELYNLCWKGDRAHFYITVPVVNFVYLCPEMYRLVRNAYIGQLHLQRVFAVLDLVVTELNFEDVDKKESLACAYFALFNNLDVLQYLWEHGFNWDEKTVLAAAQAKSTRCLNFAIEKECPLTTITLEQLLQVQLR